jgi:hypothetical protein
MSRVVWRRAGAPARGNPVRAGYVEDRHSGTHGSYRAQLGIEDPRPLGGVGAAGASFLCVDGGSCDSRCRETPLPHVGSARRAHGDVLGRVKRDRRPTRSRGTVPVWFAGASFPVPGTFRTSQPPPARHRVKSLSVV